MVVVHEYLFLYQKQKRERRGEEGRARGEEKMGRREKVEHRSITKDNFRLSGVTLTS